MAELFVLALLGHLVGDYLLQSKRMALGKSQEGIAGIGWCAFHVALYTAAVAVFWQRFDLVTLLLIFVPHFVMDRYSLGSAWLKLIRGRTFESAYTSTDKYREFDIAFTCLVYAVVDNTFHLLSLWAVAKFWLLRS